MYYNSIVKRLPLFLKNGQGFERVVWFPKKGTALANKRKKMFSAPLVIRDINKLKSNEI